MMTVMITVMMMVLMMVLMVVLMMMMMKKTIIMTLGACEVTCHGYDDGYIYELQIYVLGSSIFQLLLWSGGPFRRGKHVCGRLAATQQSPEQNAHRRCDSG